ncbi:MAG TPA: hypothetical protein PLD59_17720 [Tepidisphaeraceae bacterium]|nr:hypothetical protein [Tepidisphaeraceae bacterium]
MSRLKMFAAAAVGVSTAGFSTAALSCVAFGQEAPAPTSVPAEVVPAEVVVVEVPADQTSPRGALKVLTRAMDDGDIAVAQRVMLSESDDETSWAAAMLRLSTASVTTRRASVQAFGDEGAKAIIGDAAAATAFALAAIDRSSEELQGDQALVRSSDGVEAPIELKKINGEWRVPVKVFVGDAPAEKLAETAEKMGRQADAIESFCTDMAAGKYKSPEDAAQALQLAQVKAVFGEPNAPAPTTQQSPG